MAVAKKCKYCEKWLNNCETLEDHIEANQQIIKMETMSKIQWKRMFHGFSFLICVFASYCGFAIFFDEEITVIDSCMYMCEWLMAIFFLLLWKFTD